MASTSSSSIQKSFKYDVFLSFRGEDTRKNFVDHLYYALKQKGVVTYKDDDNIEKGKRINEQLIKSIEDSRCYIIVFSKNYASSSWCLDELVKIMECQKMTEHTAYPIFYDVQPTEIRKQIGAVKDAFAENKKKEAAGKWRKAMEEAAGLAGSVLEDMLDGHESKFIQKIVQDISRDLHSNDFILDEELIGMETRIRDVVSSLEINVDDVRMLGIWGMGGAGKTTLAKAVFDQISFQFEGKSFVENVREESKPSLSGLKSLQKQVLSDISNDQGVTVSGPLDGKNKMKKAMGGRKVLLVLDDVNHKDQLESLAGNCNWFKPGSRIIITTRDKQVLAAHGVGLIHNVTLLSQAEAGCLFSRHAFGRENPIQGYEELSRKVLQYADGLPLTIKVMGSHLRDLDESEWKNAIKRLETIPVKDTMEVLEISFDGLDNDHKEIFLDVACILKGWGKADAIRALESRGFHATYGLRVLEQKSLITISSDEYKELDLHDHLEEMGRNIVRRSHPDEPQRHSRLWVNEEIKDILANDLGTQATKCLYFHPPEGFIAEITVKGLAKMKDLRFIHIETSYECDWKFDKVSEYLPSSLRYMRWWGFPFSSLPNTFQGKHLVGLELYESNIVQLWEDGEEKVLNNLRFLKIRWSNLRTFDLWLAPNLEQLTIEYCKDFRDLHVPAHCRNLKYLYLSHSKLTTLHLGNTPNLETLILKGCNDLVELQMPAESLKLEFLELTDSKLKNLHLGSTPNLERLILGSCNDLVELQMPAESPKLEKVDLSYSKLKTVHLGNTPNLEKLFIIGCDLIELQMPAESLKLAVLDLSHSKLTNLHPVNTPNLKSLTLECCYELVELQMPAESLNLEYLNLSQSKLKTVHLGNTPKLEKLFLIGCNDLIELQMPAESPKLERVDLSRTKLKNLHLGNTPNLEKLILKGCDDLVYLQMPAESPKLECLDLTYSKLKNLHLGNTPNLKTLILVGCHDLVELQMPAESPKLERVDLRLSKLKNLHLGNTPNLETLILEGCDDLVELKVPDLKLQELYLSHSKLKTLHLGNTPNLERLRLKGCIVLAELQMPVESLKLKYLDLSHSQLKTIHLGNTPNLEELILICYHKSYSNLRTLNLGLTPNLKRLNLKNCYYLVEINAPVGYLKKLAFLDLSGCGRFKSFVFDKWSQPAEDGSLSELHLIAEPTDVCLLHPDNSFPKFRFECYYKEDPNSSFGNLEILISMGLCACTNLENFSRSICSLRGLRKLTLEGCIPEVPWDLDQLECLEELVFSSTDTKILPDSICMLKHLKAIKLKSCWHLEKLPEDLGRLQCLEELDLTECIGLRDIPNSICQLKCLKNFRLPYCLLVENIPEEIGSLIRLEELNIVGTGIIHLPQSIFQLKCVRIFGYTWQLQSYGFTSMIQTSTYVSFSYIFSEANSQISIINL